MYDDKSENKSDDNKIFEAIPEPACDTSAANEAEVPKDDTVAAAEQMANDVFTVGEELGARLGDAAKQVREAAPRAAEKLETIGEKILRGAAKGRSGVAAAVSVGRAVSDTVEKVRERGGAPLERLVDKLWKTDPLPHFPRK
jgi:hypothetical protein